MSGRLNRLWLLPALLLASQSWALGLGDIRLSSALNEPLRAEIVLLSATPDELTNLTVRLASVDTFERYDLDRPLYLTNLEFELVISGTVTGSVVRVTSSDPVAEPFITFLVEAVWSRGRLLREYTLLLDPPTFALPPVTQTTQAITAPTRVTQADRGQIQRPAPQPAAPQPAAPQQPPAAESPAQDSPVTPPPAAADTSPAVDESSFDTQAGGDIVVQRGDTLWSISQRMRPDSRLTVNQMMLAIYEANPQAFGGSSNVLSAGASLRIPSTDEVFRIARGDALAEVQRQNDSWGGTSAGFAPPSQAALELVSPDDDVVLFDDDAGQTAVDTVVEDFADPAESRIDQIEGWLIEHQNSVIEISDNELAALRAELAELRGEAPPEPLPTEEVASVAADDAVADDEPETLVPDDDATAVDAVPEDAAPEEVTPEVADTAPPAFAASPSEDNLIDTILGYVTSIWGIIGGALLVAMGLGDSLIDTILGYVTTIWGIIGGALLVAMGLLVWFARRSGDAEEEDDATGTWEALDHDDDDKLIFADSPDDDETMLADPLDGEKTIPADPLDGDDDPAPASGDDLETLVAPLDDEATTLADTGASELADSAALPDDVDSADSSTEATGEMPSVSGSTDLDLDLDDLTAALKISEIGETVVKPKIVDDAATVEQPMIVPGDIDSAASGALNDGRTMTEVGTKLDLARAYVDMGDPGSARSILEEVLDEGDDGQRQQAQQLLESLPS